MDSLFDDLEAKIRELWPKTKGGWGLHCISETWYYECGIDSFGGWKYSGVSDTLPKALLKLIEFGELDNS